MIKPIIDDWSNAEVAAYQIEKHGRDRYPTSDAQFIKLVEEVGELGKELNRLPNVPKIKGEMADVALALYNLAAKWSINLDAEIRSKVDNDTRKF